MIWDLLRVVTIVLFGLAVGETAWIVRQYFGVLVSTRRLLPYHVFMIGGGLLGLEGEAAWQNATRFGEGFTGYLPLNVFLFSLTYAALLSMRIHITRKRDLAKEILSLTQDKQEMP